MARIYAHKKGKSGSTRAHRTSIPSWLRYKPEELEGLVLKLSKEGNKPAMIGTIMRDSYGVPSVKLVTGKRVAKILNDGDMGGEVPADLFDLLVKAVRVREHLLSNHKDIINKRSLSQIEMKIKRLMEYYRRTGAIPKKWKYTPEVARILVSGGR